MADTEEYFPRGGKKPTLTHFKQSANFLGAPEKIEKKKRKPKKKQEGDDGYLSDEDIKLIGQSCKNCASGLSYKIIKEGLLVLGRVKHIIDTKVVVSLPCRIIASLMACHISEAYNKLLEAYVNDQADRVPELHNMFKAGQYIACKVLEVKETSVMVSVMPQHVNYGKTHLELRKGLLMQAAVSSLEDHGYVMDIGIPNTRAFLPKSNSNPEINLDVGMITWCCIKSATPSSDNSIVTLSNELSSLQNTMLKHKPNSHLLPGSTLEFMVETPLPNGIEGYVFKDMTSYVQRQHSGTAKGKKPTLGQKIRAQLLYVMPTRNTPFLTMKNIFETTYPDMETEQMLKDGDIIEDAQVLKITGRSIYFKLASGSYGTMSLKRIQVHEDLSDEEIVAKSYPIGSTHKVRVLGYNLSDFVYSVTDQQDVLNQKYFSYHNLAIGQIVDATVKTVSDNHVLLNVGRVSGYVPQIHMFESGIFVHPTKSSTSKLPIKKFKVGSAVKARVLSVDPMQQTLFLTLKPSLLAADLEVLYCYEQAQVGKAYTGVIKTIRDFILVTFFNNVIAFVPKHYVTKEPLENITDAFHIGQIVNCTILKVCADTKKMSGSLVTVPFWPAKKREPNENRKRKQDDSEEIAVPTKKQKDEKHIEIKDEKKRKNLKKVEITEETGEDIDNNKPIKENKKKKKSSKENVSDKPVEDPSRKKKKMKRTQDNNEELNTEQEEESKKKKKEGKNRITDEKISEESDAIETDIYEDSEQILNPQELGLIDLSDCMTGKKLRKRIASLLRVMNNRKRRINKIDKKLARIESNGLNATNKKFHTAMHKEKIVVEERIKKLLDALKIAQERLKEVAVEDYKKKKVKKEMIDQEEDEKKHKIKVVDSLEPALDMPSVKDFWSANAENFSKTIQDEKSSSSEDEENIQPKKKRKKLTVAEKLAKARDEEERVREMEKRAVESESQPRSSDQFERSLLANPNCSQLWIAYMAFHLQSTEIDKARAVGRKALKTISFREEEEKLNVWLAMINFENRFGTKETQQATLEEALQMNEPFKVHSKLLDIYVETSKTQELAGLVDRMMRKYKRDPNSYIQCGSACFKLGLVDKARQVMQKAISVLEKKDHVSVLVQFALLERSHGAGERAEALFEQVLAVYPQRVDVCSTYIDMLLKSNDIEHVRQVMERMTSQKLPARKMKILYKKWIEVEEKIGDQKQVDTIKERAMEYIQKAKF